MNLKMISWNNRKKINIADENMLRFSYIVVTCVPKLALKITSDERVSERKKKAGKQPHSHVKE